MSERRLRWQRAFVFAAALSIAALSACASKPASLGNARGGQVTGGGESERFFKVLWTMPGSYERVKVVELIGDTLYVAGTPRGMDAINIETARLRWKHTGRRTVDYPPTFRDGVLYILEGGQLVTLDVNTGDELSRCQTRIGSAMPLYPGQTTWMLGGGNEYVYGVSAGTGVKAWRVRLNDFVEKSLWDGADKVFAVTGRGTLYGISLGTRAILWNFEFSRPFTGMPCLSDGTLYVGNSNYYFHAIDATSGTLKWRTLLGAPVLGTPTAAHGRVYVSTRDGILHAVDANDGRELWKVPGPDRVITASDSRAVYLRRGDLGYRVGVLDVQKGEILGEMAANNYEWFASRPDSGTIYAVDRRGNVLALSLKNVQTP